MLKSHICWNKVKRRYCFALSHFLKITHKIFMKIRMLLWKFVHIIQKKLNPSHVLALILDSIVLKHFGESLKMKEPILFSLCRNKVHKQKNHVAVFKPKLESFTHWRAFVSKRSSSGCSRLSYSGTTQKNNICFVAYTEERIN